MTRLVLRNPSSLFGGDLLSDLNLSNFLADPVTDLRSSRYAKETISETDSHITLELELPGYEKSEITIDYKDHILCIEAKKENDTSSHSTNEYTIKGIDLKKSSADLKNGILTLTLEKQASAKKQQLKIN